MFPQCILLHMLRQKATIKAHKNIYKNIIKVQVVLFVISAVSANILRCYSKPLR